VFPEFATLHFQFAASGSALNAEPLGELNVAGRIEPQKDFHPIRRCDDPGVLLPITMIIGTSQIYFSLNVRFTAESGHVRCN
jgi:hypothetical protein